METSWKRPEGRREGDNGAKKGKGLDKEHVWIIHGHGQQCENWLWQWRGGMGGGGQRGENLENYNRITIKNDVIKNVHWYGFRTLLLLTFKTAPCYWDF